MGPSSGSRRNASSAPASAASNWPASTAFRARSYASRPAPGVIQGDEGPSRLKGAPANRYGVHRVEPRMMDDRAFDDAEFLGLGRRSKRDPYRLGLFASHFDPGERARAVLPIAGGTLIATDRRLLHLTTHLEVDGAWNVREVTGDSVAEEVSLRRNLDV